MADILQIIVIIANLLVAVPAAIFSVQVVGALISPTGDKKRPSEIAEWPQVAVLIPAHNEDRHVIPTVVNVLAQLSEGDRVCVVADNCSDGTAQYARAAGAEVVERINPFARGKSYALDFGIRYLSANPPQIVIFVDADCHLGDSAILELVASCCSTGRPAQGCYLILARDGAGPRMQIAEFAQVVKNRLRPRGLQVLGLPCHLAGSGMALPWDAVKAVDFASGEAAEDVKLGLDLAAAGYPPVFCPRAEITSLFPTSTQGAASQRQRWQHGHLRLIALSISHLITGAVRGKHVAFLTLDLLVPPLTLLLLIMTLLLFGGIATVAFGGPWAVLVLPAYNLVEVLVAIVVAWISFKRRPATLDGLKSIGGFIAERLLLYPRFIAGSRSDAWVRTVRESERASDD